jgi:hypothetical protein
LSIRREIEIRAKKKRYFVTGNSSTMDKIKVAVVTGQHPFDVPSFHEVFRSMSEVDFYPQHIEDFVFGDARRQYSVVVFYNCHTATPGDGQNWGDKEMLAALREVGKTAQSIFVLHHAVVAFPKWQLWSDIVGIQDRSGVSGDPDQTIHIEVPNKEHYITRGLMPFSIVDEVYAMKDAGEGSDILLTTDHPESMKTIAWTRQYKKARVFCYQSGSARAPLRPLGRALARRE